MRMKEIRSLKAKARELRQLMNSAKNEMELAEQRKSQAQRFVLNNWEFVNEENGKRITDPRQDFLMAEIVFCNDYLPRVSEAFRDMWGIINSPENDYTWPFREKFLRAKRKYLMLSVEILEDSGRLEESKAMRDAINGYINPSIENKIIEANNTFCESAI